MADYRESPALLIADPYGNVTADNPPPTQPGMAHVRLDGAGRLREFSAVPYNDSQPLTPAVQPEAVFRAAGLEIAAFTEIPPNFVPSSASDQVRSWNIMLRLAAKLGIPSSGACCVVERPHHRGERAVPLARKGGPKDDGALAGVPAAGPHADAVGGRGSALWRSWGVRLVASTWFRGRRAISRAFSMERRLEKTRS